MLPCFVAPVVPALITESSFRLAPCPRLVFIFPASAISPRRPDSFILFVFENGVRNQDLRTGCACCYWGAVASWPSQEMELGNIYIYIYIKPYTHTLIIIFVSIP